MGTGSSASTSGEPGAPPSCAQHYERLHAECLGVMKRTFAHDTDARQAESHSLIAELERWLDAIGVRPERYVLRLAAKEYQFALLSLVQGLYRNAFSGLRLFFELGLAAVHFSSNCLELNEWLSGDRDLNWSALTDSNDGIFSKRYARAFFPGLTDVALDYGGLATSVYRECSEYVHGNADTHVTLPDTVEFDSEAFGAWHDKAKVVATVMTFALCLRYLPELDTSGIGPLEPSLQERVGHVSAIRERLGGPVEEQP